MKASRGELGEGQTWGGGKEENDEYFERKRHSEDSGTCKYQCWSATAKDAKWRLRDAPAIKSDFFSCG